jgi:SAM-dependent methyltransferase
MEPPSRSNDDQTRYQAQYRNGPEAGHWLVQAHRYEPMLAPFTGLVLGAAAVARTDRVLDVGCGTGSTTCTAARDADDGVDISRSLLLRAEQRARQEGLTNVGFEHGDAQTHRLAPSGFDAAISRFGVMFFSDPRPRSPTSHGEQDRPDPAPRRGPRNEHPGHGGGAGCAGGPPDLRRCSTRIPGALVTARNPGGRKGSSW